MSLLQNGIIHCEHWAVYIFFTDGIMFEKEFVSIKSIPKISLVTLDGPVLYLPLIYVFFCQVIDHF